MPYENGMEIAGALRELSPETGIVFVTTSRDHAIDAFALDALHYLSKPVTTEGIVKSFRRLTELRARQQETISISVGGDIYTVHLSQICTLESSNHAVEIVLLDGRLRHDLRHHLNTLGALNAQGRQEEITKYLKQYGAVYDRLGRQNICANPVVDGVLEYYLALARSAEVSVKHRIALKASTGVESADMTVLLGNCLENALEALRQLPEGQRRLSIEMINAGAAIVLCIKNTCKGMSGSREPTGWEEFVSTKGADHRGVGLRSVTAIAEKYDGSAQFQCRDGVFTTRIILNPT